MYIEKTIHCNCLKNSVVLTAIQYADFDCGCMGYLYCPNCKAIMMPSDSRKTIMMESMQGVEGKDPGWILPEIEEKKDEAAKFDVSV